MLRARAENKPAKLAMSLVSARLKFIEPQLASPVDEPAQGKH